VNVHNQETFKSGYVSIIGEPNVGKSSLLNGMIGEKLAIVTPKPQTTRNQIKGIVTTERYQLIFLDTPGIVAPKYLLHDEMVKAAHRAIKDADVVMYMVDGSQLPPALEAQILDRIRKAESEKAFLVINKIDLLESLALLPIIAQYRDKFPFVEIVPISAKNPSDVLRLRDLIVAHLPTGPLYFPGDQISDLPERFFVGETVREKIFLKTQQEIPYASGVTVEEFKHRSNGRIYIRAIIYTERLSQKRILIGDHGSMIKQIGTLARQEIEQFLNASVFLELQVYVKGDWRRDARKLKDMGYA
jgi:GTP-binding protein Era